MCDFTTVCSTDIWIVTCRLVFCDWIFKTQQVFAIYNLLKLQSCVSVQYECLFYSKHFKVLTEKFIMCNYHDVTVNVDVAKNKVWNLPKQMPFWIGALIVTQRKILQNSFYQRDQKESVAYIE